MKQKNYFLIIAAFIIVSCGEIRNEVATDQLLGTYQGKASFTYHHSLHNIGLQDEIKSSQGSISIFKNSSGEVYIKDGGANIKLSGLTLATNGTLFNIPYQKVVQQNGTVLEIQGKQTAELEGRKYDGIFYTQSNSLTFSYETVTNHNYWGQTAEVGVTCLYEFAKK